jgi:quercetin dioxygenase-like cupin family protein
MPTAAEERGVTIADYLSLRHCTVLKGRGQAWTTPNSLVASVPALSLGALSTACPPSNLTTSIVKVAGPTHEPMHFHTSFIVGLVVTGSGILRFQNAARREAAERVECGDVIIIPRGALHVFITADAETMDYIALEFSDKELDYQAHWTESLH